MEHKTKNCTVESKLFRWSKSGRVSDAAPVEPVCVGRVEGEGSNLRVGVGGVAFVLCRVYKGIGMRF